MSAIKEAETIASRRDKTTQICANRIFYDLKFNEFFLYRESRDWGVCEQYPFRFKSVDVEMLKKLLILFSDSLHPKSDEGLKMEFIENFLKSIK